MQFIFVHSHCIRFSSKLSREETARIYYTDSGEQFPRDLLQGTMGGKSPEASECQNRAIYKLLTIWIFLEPQKWVGHLSLSAGQPDSIREFYLKFSDSNFKTERKINSKKKKMLKSK